MMADLFWPADIVPSSVEWRIIDSTAVFNSALSGVTRTVSRPGTRLACTLNFSALSGQDRGRVQGVLANLRGRSNRIWIYDNSYTQRGSFPATELVENNTFAASTGWTAGAYHSLVLQDRVMRVARSVTGTSAAALYETAGNTPTTYAAYASRAFLREGRGTFTSTGARISTTAGGSYAGTDTTGYGLKTTQSSSDTATSLFFTLQDSQTSGTVAGDYFDVLYTSLSRCAVVDNGLNALTYSDQIDNAAWVKTKSTCAGANINAFTAPDGTLTGDRLVESSDAGNEYHYITGYSTKPASSQWWTIYGAFRAGDGGTIRDRVVLKIGDVSNFTECSFDLTAGTAGTASNTGSATSGKSYIQSLGGGWYYCAVITLLPAATTNVNCQTFLVSSTSVLYTGNGAGNIGVWRLGAAASQYPVRLTQTTTAAVTGTSQTGAALHLKALPASTNSLLLPGDWVECSGQLNMVTAPLNSDAAGLGYLQLQRSFTTTPADNAPVIVNRPMGRFLLAEDEVSWGSRPGILSDFSVSFVEDIA
jgi:hypothetical protein